MEIIDKHFNEMIRIECPYYKTICDTKNLECHNCKANTQKILFTEIPTEPVSKKEIITTKKTPRRVNHLTSGFYIKS